MRKTKKIISVILCAVIVCSTFIVGVQAKSKKKYVKSISIKKKASITIPASKKSITKTYKVTVKVNGKASKKFTTKSSNKSVAAVKAVGKKIKVTAKKAGTVKIKVTTKAKNLKKKKLSKTLTLKVKKASVKSGGGKNTPAVEPSSATESVPAVAPTMAPTVEPTGETVTQPVSEPETEPADEPARIDEEYETLELRYNEYCDNKVSSFTRMAVKDIVIFAKEDAEYTAEIADTNIADILLDEENKQEFYSVSAGETKADIFEKIGDGEKTKLGTINIVVSNSTMAELADNVFDNDMLKKDVALNYVWLKLNFDKKTYDIGSIIKDALIENEDFGIRFTDKDYTVTYTSDDEKVAVVSEDGVISGVKNGTTYVDANFTFKDGSTTGFSCEVKVTGAAIEKVDGYTIDNVRDYIVGVNTPVELADGTKTPLINFDNAATTPAFKAVQDAINEELEMYGSIGRGFSQKSNHSTDVYNNTRDKVLDFFNADPEAYTCFYVNSTTDGLNKLASALVESEDDVVLTTRIEHHANDLSWRERCKVIYAEVDEKGRVIYDDIEKLLKENKVKIVSISAASNVTGYVNDVHRVAKMAHKYGAKIVVDGAQIVAHRKFSMTGDTPEENIDFIAFSAHKMYSPYGGGAVVGLTEELNKHMPEFYGGGTITVVGDDWQVYKDAPAAYEAGSPNYPGVVGLGKAIDVLSTIGMDKIQAHEKVMNQKMIDGLKKLDNVIIYGDSENIDDRVGVITFNFSDINTFLLAKQLSGLGGIATRRGAFCAHPYVWRLMGVSDEEARGFENCTDANTAGMIRVSFGIYNNEEEIEQFFKIMPDAMKAAKAEQTEEIKAEY